MDTEIAACVLRSAIFMVILGLVYKLIYKRAAVDEFESDVDELLKELSEVPREASLPTNSQVLAQLRRTLECMRNRADKITLLRFVFAGPRKTDLSCGVSQAELEVLREFRTRISVRIAKHLVTVSPVLWPLAILMGIARGLGDPARRLFLALVSRAQLVAETFCDSSVTVLFSVDATGNTACGCSTSESRGATHSATWTVPPSADKMAEPESSRNEKNGATKKVLHSVKAPAGR